MRQLLLSTEAFTDKPNIGFPFIINICHGDSATPPSLTALSHFSSRGMTDIRSWREPSPGAEGRQQKSVLRREGRVSGPDEYEAHRS